MNRKHTYKVFFIVALLAISVIAKAQTSQSDGPFLTGSNWAGGSFPGSLGGGVLTLNNETINLNHYMELGSYSADDSNDVDVNATNSNDNGEFIVNDTLIVHGDMNFENKSMQLTVTDNGVLIILGDLNMNNKIDVSSDGLIIVSGTFTMSGSSGNNEYSGGGAVYAGGYGGNAESEIDSGGGGDASKTIDQLSDDGFQSIEDYVNNNGSTTLPITLASFTVTAHEQNVELAWTTLTEENFEYFEIQRASSDGEFKTIETVSGSGNSDVAINYEWSDENPMIGLNYYRLISNDYDGYREIFDARAVMFQPKNFNPRPYPNAVARGSELHIKGLYNQSATAKIHDMSGNQLIEMTVDEYRSIPTTQMRKGIYFLEISLNGIIERSKIIVK